MKFQISKQLLTILHEAHLNIQIVRGCLLDLTQKDDFDQSDLPSI